MNVSEPRLERGIEELGDMLSKLFDLQRTIGTEILDIFTKGIGTSFQGTIDRLSDLRLPSWRPGSCCDIPEPCWMPRSLGQFRCRLCAGSTGSLQLAITNED